MDNNNYSLISPEQIDIDAVAEYIVSSKKLVYRDGDTETQGAKAQDVDKVGGVLAENIAVVPDKNDRNTVKNALQLGGVDASEYMTETSGASLRTKQGQMKLAYGDEIVNLKDELYQLKQELAKSGIIEDRGQYHGYADLFRTGIIKHISEEYTKGSTIGTAATNQITISDTNAINGLDVYDYIVVENSKTNLFQIKQIKAKTGNLLTLDSEIDAKISASEMNVYLSKGIVQNGSFEFATNPEQQQGSEENHTGLSDDTYRFVKNITVPYTGFGYSFRVPTEKQGYVTSFEISVAAKGNPGALTCYLIDSRDVDKFINPTQAEQAYQAAQKAGDNSFYFFAKSKPLAINSSEGRRYRSFDFMQSDGRYPIMSMDKDGKEVRYVAIVESSFCDATNNYCMITFLSHMDANGKLVDLELNNTTYTYLRREDNATQSALTATTEAGNGDMYYHITTRNVVENEAEALKEGLYTFKTTLKNGDTGNIARLMLRIKREGMYAVSIKETVPTVKNQSTIDIVNKDVDNGVKTPEELRLKTNIYNPLELRETENAISQESKTIIGSNITTIGGIQGASEGKGTVTVSTPVLINNDDPIYRVGYLVSLKARKVTFNTETGVYEATAYDHFTLPLVNVFKDFSKFDEESSDRLLFESKLQLKNQEIKDYNDFIVQVYWSNPELSTYADIKKSQMGAIKDIVLSIDKSF